MKEIRSKSLKGKNLPDPSKEKLQSPVASKISEDEEGSMNKRKRSRLVSKSPKRGRPSMVYMIDELLVEMRNGTNPGIV